MCQQKEMQRCRGAGAGLTGTEMLTEILERRTDRRDLSVLMKMITNTPEYNTLVCTYASPMARHVILVPTKSNFPRSSLNECTYVVLVGSFSCIKKLFAESARA